MDKILVFIKKYTSLLIPAGIALFGVIFIVLTVMFAGPLKEKMAKSARQGQTVDRLIGSAHSTKDVENETYYQNQLEDDSKKVEQLARQTTQRDLIAYDIFPEPDDSSVQIFSSFGKKYRIAIEGLLKKANARSAPTSNEISSELAKRGSSKKTTKTRQRFKRVKRGDAFDLMKDAFLKKRAGEMSLYATAKIFDWYSFWEDQYSFVNEETAVKHCWYSQMAYWVYEDVVESVKSLNSGSSSVFNSDVKRLVGVNFTRNADYLKETNRKSSGHSSLFSGSSTQGDVPEYILKAQEEGVFGFNPWTARICDDNIDVIHFSVAVIISADSVFSFIKELCSEKEHSFKGYLKEQAPARFKRNQVSVLQYLQEPIDQTAIEHARYRYGDKAVVKLSLTCEYIFNRSGYDEIKPTSIIDSLKVDQNAGMNMNYGI